MSSPARRRKGFSRTISSAQIAPLHTVLSLPVTICMCWFYRKHLPADTLHAGHIWAWPGLCTVLPTIVLNVFCWLSTGKNTDLLSRKPTILSEIASSSGPVLMRHANKYPQSLTIATETCSLRSLPGSVPKNWKPCTTVDGWKRAETRAKTFSFLFAVLADSLSRSGFFSRLFVLGQHLKMW